MERETHLKEAIAQCFQNREAVNVANVRKKLPEDFFFDFDADKPLDEMTIFREIQATFKSAPQAAEHAPAPLIEDRPDGQGKLATVESVEENEIAEPAPIASTPSHAATGPGHQSPQERLDAARAMEGNLLAERPSLQIAQRHARDALQEAKIAYAQIDPHRQSPAELSAEFRKASQEQRAARARGEAWATPPERKARGQRAYVDVARDYAQGGDANTFARAQNRYGNTRGAFGKHALGTVNRDPSRGPVPKPVEPRKPTIPALAK